MYQCITVHILIFMFGYRAVDWGAVDWAIILFSAMHCLDIGNCSGGTDSTCTDDMSKMAASLLGAWLEVEGLEGQSVETVLYTEDDDSRFTCIQQ